VLERPNETAGALWRPSFALRDLTALPVGWNSA
jgi:hypothetical protein